MKAYLAEMERCAFRLLEAFCLGLGMPPSALHHLFEVGRLGRLGRAGWLGWVGCWVRRLGGRVGGWAGGCLAQGGVGWLGSCGRTGGAVVLGTILCLCCLAG